MCNIKWNFRWVREEAMVNWCLPEIFGWNIRFESGNCFSRETTFLDFLEEFLIGIPLSKPFSNFVITPLTTQTFLKGCSESEELEELLFQKRDWWILKMFLFRKLYPWSNTSLTIVLGIIGRKGISLWLSWWAFEKFCVMAS